jgi:protein SCO1
VSYLAVSVTFFGAASLIGFIYYLDQRKSAQRKKMQRAAVGKMAIGGPFSLITHEKKAMTDKDFRGQWLLIYFGFTHCPDICPEELEKLAEVTDSLRKQKDQQKYPFQPLFVSVDPERDTPELISRYIKDYSPHFIGLTGTRDQVAEMCKHYRVYFSQGPKIGDDYIVDHAIIMYLINPDGEFVDYYGRNKTATDVTHAIEQHMNAFQSKSK